MSEYRTNSDGTTWAIQEVKFDEFERNVLENPTLRTITSFDNFGQACKFFCAYCSGANDGEGPCENQNYSEGHFFRIVELHPFENLS